MSTMQLIGLCLSALNLGVFIWGVWGVFRKYERMQNWLSVLKIGFLIGTVVQLATIVRADPNNTNFAPYGIVVLLLSLILFILTARATRAERFTLAFSEDVPKQLMRRGPHGWMRHPFYSSYMATYFAGWLISRDPWMLAVILGMGIIYLRAALMEEAKFAKSPLSANYQDYKASTGMFFPRPEQIWKRCCEFLGAKKAL